MFRDEPGDVSEPLGEARKIAVQDRELGHERKQANVERALEKLVGRLKRGGKVDRGAIESVIGGRKLSLRRRDEIHELGVALKVEIGAAGIFIRDERQRKGVGRQGSGGDRLRRCFTRRNGCGLGRGFRRSPFWDRRGLRPFRGFEPDQVFG